METNKAETDVETMFNGLVEELEGLRQEHLKSLETLNTPIHTVIKDVEDLSQRQLNVFETVNGAASNFSSEEIVKRLDNIETSIETSDRNSAISLIAAVKAALQDIDKLRRNDRNKKTLNNKLLECHKSVSKKSTACVLNNGHFNRCLNSIIDYYYSPNENGEAIEESRRSSKSGKDDGTQECSDFGDFTICTIRSESVMTSSPLK